MPCSVGIFWGISDSKGRCTLVIDATSLDYAESYGEFLTHPRGHYEVWSDWQKLGIASLRKRGLPEAIAFHEYEDLPRGRIVYRVEFREFIVYADRKLQAPSMVNLIVSRFELPIGQYVVRSDPHYRS
jgi:hypothetical protein